MFNPIRTVARQMLASMFVVGGLDALRNPEERAASIDEDVLEPVARQATQQIPQLEALDAPEMVQLNGAVQVAGGLLLALGKAPRIAATALAASLVPTTLATHRYWEETDPEVRANQQVHFFKNISMLGGLLLGALDTEGRPGFAWRSKHAASHVGIRADQARREASLRTDVAVEKAKRAAAETKAASRRTAQKVATAAAVN